MLSLEEVYILNVISCVHLCTQLYSHVMKSENGQQYTKDDKKMKSWWNGSGLQMENKIKKNIVV